MKFSNLCFFLFLIDLIAAQDLENINNLSTVIFFSYGLFLYYWIIFFFVLKLEIINGYGYPYEEHKVTTEDGYILTLHRIPYGKNCDFNSTKGPVLLQHGLLSSSADWVIMGPRKGFAFILADHCYDVWMGNSRGSYYSREHETLTMNDNKFWEFSWHEMGVYDLPAVIDYVLDKTGYPDLFYIGHSQGTTQFWIFNEFNHSYESKVKAMFALAPIAFLGHSKSLVLQIISQFQYIASVSFKQFDRTYFIRFWKLNLLQWIVQWIGWNEFLPKDGILSQFGEALCKESIPLATDICSSIVFLICGFDSDQMNRVNKTLFSFTL